MFLSLGVMKGQTTIFDFTGSNSTLPVGWTGNNAGGNDIERGSYFLVETGAVGSKDEIISSSYDLSAFTSATFTCRVATFGSGSANPALIEFSVDGGATYTQSGVTATPSSSSYILSGDIDASTVSATFVVKITNNGTSGRGVRLRDFVLTAESASGNPIVGFDALSSAVVEGAAGATLNTFIPVTMDAAPVAPVMVTVTSTDGTATTADNDYTAVNTTLNFLPSDTYPNTQNVSVSITGDDTIEADEILTLDLVVTSGTADAGTAIHTLTISNDDVAPPAEVVINEIMYDALDSEVLGEWIEILNTGASVADLSCYVITDGDWDISIPSGTTIAAGDYLTIGRSTAEDGVGGTFTPDLNLSTCNCASSLSTSTGAISLTNTGEFVALFDDSANFVDGFTFESPTSGNSPASAGTETVNAQGGCPGITVDIAGNTALTGPGGTGARANNFEDAGTAVGTSGNGITVGRFPDGSATFRYFEGADISPGSVNVLPVELANFAATTKAEQVEISWTTIMELNNSHFEVQHSTDNRTFTALDKVQGAGNSDAKLDYSYTHSTPANGINYYRLQQFDFDGQNEYSQVVSVRFGKEAGISVYPNPVQGVVNIALSEEFNTNATAEIISQNGNTVSTQIFTTKSFSQSINVNDLPTGVYVLRVVNGNDVYTERFVKK